MIEAAGVMRKEHSDSHEPIKVSAPVRQKGFRRSCLAQLLPALGTGYLGLSGIGRYLAHALDRECLHVFFTGGKDITTV
jgi:hypothetical protein